MQAIILAAGLGWRLGGGEEQPPKCLLRFDDRSLLARHLDTLARIGVDAVHLGIGYRAADVEHELRQLAPRIPVHTVHNPHYRDGNIVTLHTLREALAGGGEILLMDADVLYHPEVLERLAGSVHRNCLLLDRDFEEGEEPVKLCVHRGEVVEFGKQLPADLAFDLCGESVGFFKLGADMAGRLAQRADAYLRSGRREAFYEDALRDLLLELPGEFGYEDVTGIPWIEIDFQQDVERAESEVLALINARAAA